MRSKMGVASLVQKKTNISSWCVVWVHTLNISIHFKAIHQSSSDLLLINRSHYMVL